MAEPNDWTPRKVVLFSGHMIDAPGREKPRFPPDKEPIAAGAIADALAGLGVGAERPLHLRRRLRRRSSVRRSRARALCARLELYIPFDEATFLKKSVDFAGGDWRARFFAAKARATLHVLPLERGETPDGRGSLRTQESLDAGRRLALRPG